MQITKTNDKSPFLRIRIDQISPMGLVVKEELSLELIFDLLKEPKNQFAWQPFKSAHIHLNMKPEKDAICLQGQGAFYLSCACVRCLNDVPFLINLQLNLRLFAKEKEAALEPHLVMESLEIEADSTFASEDQDLTTAYYENKTIDLAVVIREQLFLDLPLYPACDHELSLNRTNPCGFYKINKLEKVDLSKKPFMKLANWKKQLPEN